MTNTTEQERSEFEVGNDKNSQGWYIKVSNGVHVVYGIDSESLAKDMANRLNAQFAQLIRERLAGEHGESVPSGWKLVPIEPTDKMLAAFHKYRDESLYVAPFATTIAGYYKAMLKVAPTLTDTQEKG